MTREEIIETLQMCADGISNGDSCDGCPLIDMDDCEAFLMERAADLLEQDQADS